MKKNKMMRFASLLLVLTLLSTCAISGTFAKYTSSTYSQDSARVAHWGFDSVTMDLSGLFVGVYDNTVDSQDETDVIAPGTTGSDTFVFNYDANGSITAPEVDYTFTISTEGSQIAESIKNNTNIQWKLDTGDWGTWDQLMTAIKTLSGDASGSKDYEAGNLPTEFNNDKEHTVSWQWVFATTTGDGQPATQDGIDTGMGNADSLAEVTIKITITATQKD